MDFFGLVPEFSPLVPNKIPMVFEEDLIIFTDQERHLYSAFFWMFTTVAVCGNFSVILLIFKKKTNLFYQCCLVSLASSDLLLGLFAGSIHLVSLSSPMMTWSLGKQMCSLIPFVEIMSLVANSMTLTSIAINRYQTIVHTFRYSYEFSKTLCFFIMAAIWIVSAAIAYPMINTYKYVDMLALKQDPNNATIVVDAHIVQRCITFQRKSTYYYFAVLLTFVFVPLLITFLYLYIQIATLIWLRRKHPCEHGSIAYEHHLNVTQTCKETAHTSKTSTSTATKSGTRHVEITESSTNAGAKHLFIINPPSATSRLASMRHRKSMQRKVRAFRVIIVLMIIFIVCKLPVWVFMLAQTKFTLNKPIDWTISMTLSIVSLFNSAVNPFLYMFLNETISFQRRFVACVKRCWK